LVKTYFYSIFEKIIFMMDIGNKLKTLRVKKKLEVIDMAEILKISVNTYRKYERNESAPDLNMLEKIANVHEVSILDLLKEDNYTFNNNENKDCNINNLVINNLSEKLIEQYEERIKELKETIVELKSKK
jgi:transcriptional regulator with XRE-family HTH domain